MSNAIDTRIVELQFDNMQFQREVSNSISSLKNLDNQLMLKNGTGGFDAVQRSAGKLDFSGVQKQTGLIETALEKVKGVGVGVFSALTDAAGMFVKGASLVTGVLNTGVVAKSIQGGWNRASNIGKAKFQLEGLGVKWEQISDSLNFAVDNTAYGLDAAAVAASSLVASGVQLGDEMSTSLRAISGVAAMTNSTYEDTARIFTTIAGNGRLMGDQLNQLAGRGLNVAAELGKAMGKTEAEIREMVSKGEIDFKTFSDIMYESFGEHAVKANETFSGSLANMNAALSRTTADFFLQIRGKDGLVPIFNDLRTIINDLNKQTNPLMHILKDEKGNEVNGTIIQGVLDGLGQIHKALQTESGDGSFIKDFGNMMTAMQPNLEGFFGFVNDGLYNFTRFFFDLGQTFMILQTNLQPILGALGDAFKEVFGEHAFGDMALNMDKGMVKLNQFLRRMKPTEEQLAKIKEVAIPVFQALQKVTDVIGDLVHKGLDGIITGGRSVFNWFQDLSSKADGAGSALDTLKDKIKGIFGAGGGGGESEGVLGFISRIKDRLIEVADGVKNGDIDIMGSITEGIQNAWDLIHKTLDPQELSQLVNSLMSVITPILGVIMQFRGADIMNQLALIPDRLLTQMKTVSSIPMKFGEVLTSISAGISRLTRSVARKQTSEALVNYAKAIAILAASLIALTFVDPNKLLGAVVAIAALALVLEMMMAIGDKIAGLSSLSNALDFGALATAMVPMTIALDLMAVAVAKLGKLDEGQVEQGIVAVGKMMLLMTIMAYVLSGAKGFVGAAAGMVIAAAALLVMQVALKKFAELDSGTFEDGINRIAFALIALAGGIFIAASASGSAIRAAVGIGILVLALNGMLMLIRGFGSINVDQIIIALSTIGIVLLGLGIAVKAFSSADMTKGAANLNSAMGALGLMALVLNAIAFAITNVMNASGGNLEILITTLVGLAGVIIVMAVALEVLSKGAVGYEAGAASLLIMSAALLVLARTITILAAIPWDQLIMSFLKLFAAVVVLALIGVIADGLAAPLLSLAVTLGALAVSLLAGSAAIFLFAQGLQIIATLGGAAAENIAYTLIRIAQAISDNRETIVNAAATIGEAAGTALMGALKGVLMGLGDIIATAIPAMAGFLSAHSGDILTIGQELGKIVLTGLGQALLEIPGMIVDAMMSIPASPEMTGLDPQTFAEVYGDYAGEGVNQGNEQAAEQLASNDALQTAQEEKAQEAGEAAKEPMASALTESVNAAQEEAAANVEPFDWSDLLTGNVALDELKENLLGDMEGIGGGLGDSLLNGVSENPIDMGSLMSNLGVDESAMSGQFNDLGNSMGASLSDGLGSGLSNMGAEGGGAVSSALDTQLAEAEGRTGDFEAAGQNIGTSFGNGVNSGIEMTDIGAGINSTVQQMDAAASPASESGRKVGNQFASGEAVGIVGGGGNVSSAARIITSGASGGAGGWGSGHSVGSSFASGMASGIYSGSGAVAAAARSIVASALAAARSAAHSHSPSRLTMKQGRDFTAGYAIGIRNTVGMVRSASREMVGEGLNAVNGMMLNANDILDLVDWDAEPTITPVLDLSEVERGVGIMDSMMVSNQVRSAAHASRIYSDRNAEPLPTTQNTTNINVQLDWRAGASVNQVVQELASQLSLYKATEGR